MECTSERSLQESRQYLEEGFSMRVEVEELESLLGPEDSEVFFMRILEDARNKQGRATFETFQLRGAPSEFLVVSRARWDEHQRKMSVQKEELRRTPITLQQNSFSSMSERQWQADLDEQRDGLEPFGKKSDSFNWKITWTSVSI